MVSRAKRWKTLLFFALGIALGTAFCMKWIEPDLWVNGERISIVGLEVFYPREKVIETLSALNDKTSMVLTYHLRFDFMFMAGIFPFIAAMCVVSSQNTYPVAKKILLVAAALQFLAWACDIYENTRLLHWLNEPVIAEKDFLVFHIAVIAKWIISLGGILLALPFFFIKRKPVALN